MQFLLDAIYSKWTGTTAIATAFPGGYSRDIAPEGTGMPFMVSVVVASPSQAVYGAIRRGNPYVRFSAVGIGHDAVATALKTFTDVFDDFILALTTGTNYDSQRVTDPIPMREPQVDGTGQDIWRWSVDYRFSIRQ